MLCHTQSASPFSVGLTLAIIFLGGFVLLLSSTLANAAEPVIDEDGWVWDAEIWADYKTRGTRVEEIVAAVHTILIMLQKEGVDPRVTTGIAKGLAEAIENAKTIGQYEGITEAANYIENDCPADTEDSADEERMFGNPFHSAALAY